MTRSEPAPTPVYLRVGHADEALIDTVHVTTPDEGVTEVARLLIDFACGILRADGSNPDDFALVPPSPGG
ncbi:hypothetical protein [Streptomyces anulatus]|uniref:Uncharacterized protein n=1 Tax=Streptomyces anulatus TaxID=1892 RepID=A0ABZ1ZLX9_STRAQ|nr:hypothetical protein [Streptomyces anulatus]